MVSRRAKHAGSWYSESTTKLSQELNGWLDQVPDEIDGVGKLPPDGARVIIAPHAGYSYSGPAAAWAYRALDVSKAKRIFLLGPSHNWFLPGCALTRCDQYATPLGPLKIDEATTYELYRTGKFQKMPIAVDENEHSLEMHLSYIYMVLSRQFSSTSWFPPLTPILVGSTDLSTEKMYGEILAPYLADPTSIFIISSDFCHWGSRFSYTYYLPTSKSSSKDGRAVKSNDTIPSARWNDESQIHESIGLLDRMAMDAVESGQHESFLKVLRETGNTVCGRHPIGVAMAAIEKVIEGAGGGGAEGVEMRKGRFKFVRYERSNDVTHVSDSSVSYASAFAIL